MEFLKKWNIQIGLLFWSQMEVFEYVGTTCIKCNLLLDTPQHPMLNPEETYTQLSGRGQGGKKITKLDLSQAYQQILHEEDSRNYVTIDTCLGHFHYTCLPYWVNWVPVVSRSAMDKILSGLPVGCSLDDMIIKWWWNKLWWLFKKIREGIAKTGAIQYQTEESKMSVYEIID